MTRIVLALLAVLVGSVAASAQIAIPAAGTSNGATPFHLIAANTNNSTLVKNQPGTVWTAQLSGIGSAPAYLKFYDKATAPTCGTDTPVKVLMIPAAATAANGGGSNILLPVGVKFTRGIGICVVTGITDSDNTAPSANLFNINFDWK